MEISRRMFVGAGMTAGTGLLVAGSLGAQGGGTALRPAPPFDTTVLDGLVAEYEATLRRLRESPAPDVVRQLASHQRMLATWGRSVNLDAHLRREVATLIARVGRPEVLTIPFDPEREVARHGHRLPRSPVRRATPAEREVFIREIERQGVTARWQGMATLLEALAPAVTPARPVQWNPDDGCENQAWVSLYAETLMLLACFPTWASVIWPLCGVTVLQYLGWEVVMLLSGCW